VAERVPRGPFIKPPAMRVVADYEALAGAAAIPWDPSGALL